MTTTPPSAHDTEPPSEDKARVLTQPGVAAATPGVVTGRPLTWLRVEGDAVAGAAIMCFATTEQPWWLVWALWLLPDLSMLGYLAGRQAGAWSYNLTEGEDTGRGDDVVAQVEMGAGWPARLGDGHRRRGERPDGVAAAVLVHGLPATTGPARPVSCGRTAAVQRPDLGVRPAAFQPPPPPAGALPAVRRAPPPCRTG